jgi:hypothetical protein
MASFTLTFPMRFSLKTLLVFTAMIPISIGVIEAIINNAELTFAWIAALFFEVGSQPWEVVLASSLQKSLNLDFYQTQFLIIWMPMVPGWLTLAVLNLLLFATGHYYLKSFALLNTTMLPFSALIWSIDWGASVARQMFCGHLVGAGVSGAVLLTFWLISCRKHSNETVSGSELKPFYVTCISLFLVLVSMSGWWTLGT